MVSVSFSIGLSGLGVSTVIYYTFSLCLGLDFFWFIEFLVWCEGHPLTPVPLIPSQMEQILKGRICWLCEAVHVSVFMCVSQFEQVYANWWFVIEHLYNAFRNLLSFPKNLYSFFLASRSKTTWETLLATWWLKTRLNFMVKIIFRLNFDLKIINVVFSYFLLKTILFKEKTISQY